MSQEQIGPGEVNVHVECYRDGKLLTERRAHNLLTNIGKQEMVSRLIISPTKLFRYMRLGKNSTSPNSDQTTITTIVTGSNRTCDTAAMSGSTRTAKFTRTWLTGNFSSVGICEAGIFSQYTPGSGSMLARVTFTAINKSRADSLKISWTVCVN